MWRDGKLGEEIPNDDGGGGGDEADVEEEDEYGEDDDQDDGYGEQMGMWRVRGGYDLWCILRNKSGINWSK